MGRRPQLSTLVTFGVVALLVGAASAAISAPAQQAQAVVPDELIIGFERSLAAGVQSQVVVQAGGVAAQRYPGIDAILVRADGGALGAVGQRLAADARVRYVEPNSLVSADATPNDPSFSQLWGMHNTGQTGGTADADIDAPEAWDAQTGSASVVVGVTDSGVDFGHPDLAGRQWVNTGENCGSSDPAISCADRTDGVDDDGNGYVDDWRGWDWVNNDNNPFDDNDHGTHVAGTIGAVGNNGVGVVGVNWNVRIAALKFLNAAGSGSTANAISATLYTADEGIPISNNSWGGGPFSQALLDAIEYAAGRGTLFVAAAGNFGANNDVSPHYPSSYGADVVTAVAATEHNDNRWTSSNYGATSVDLGAPGVNILSTIPGGGYAAFNGTSMATPHVAGTAALVKARYPGATAYGLKALLMRTVDPKPSLDGVTVTGGRLNANSAVSCANSPKAVLLAPLTGFSVNTGQAVAIRVLGANCATPAGAGNVSVTVNGTPVTLTASSPDSGRYTGTFTPSSAGPLTVTATVTVGGTTDVRTATGSATGGGGGGDTYTCADISDAWVDASAGTQLPLSTDDASTTVALPFAFSYFGQSHTQAFVSTNGFLTLGSSAGANAANNAVIPATGIPNGVIAPFWDDLNPANGGSVRTLTTGTAPNRAFHVEWLNVPHFVNVGAATFELSLYETSNEIRFRYLDTDFGNPTFNTGASATAGVESQNGTQGTQYSRNQPVLTNGKAISCSQGTPPPPPALTITTTSVADGTVNQPYSQQVTAAGGSGAYSWSIAAGSLPPGLTLSPTGTPSATISGAPTTSGQYGVTVRVTDGAAATDTQSLTIVIGQPAALAITTTSLAAGTAGSAYSQQVTASGGTPPYSWNVASGSLPPGLSLSPSGTPSATISGTPTTEGTFAFTVEVDDSAAGSDTQALSITIGPAAPPGGAPLFGSAGTAAAALASTLDVPYPAGVAANDVVVLFALTRDTVDIVTPPGFTEGGGRTQGSVRAEWFWRRAVGGETGNLTIAKASGANLFFARMYRFTGVRTSGDPFEAAASNGGSGTVLTPADVTTLGANRRVVVLTALEDDLALAGYAGGTAAVPEDVAEARTALGADGALGLGSVARTAAETFDVGTQTIAYNRSHTLFTFALVP